MKTPALSRIIRRSIGRAFLGNSQPDFDLLLEQVRELTSRVHRLEKLLRVAPAETPLPQSPQSEPARIPAVQEQQHPSPISATPASPAPSSVSDREPLWSSSRMGSSDLESRIGSHWLNRIGIAAVLIGVSYFIKYAFDSGWIGPTGRIALGLLAGIALILWSERFRAKGHAPFSYSLKAVGIGTLYLSLWGAFQIYHLVPSAVAFVAMILVTASTITLALAQDAEVLAAFAMIGGFSTPLLLSTGQNHEFVLFSYICLLDLAILAMVRVKPWRRLLVGSFIGTWTLYAGWFAEYYTKDQRTETVVFALIFGAIFAAVPLLTPLTKSRWHSGFSITLTLLPLVNAATLFVALKAMYDNEALTWYALGL